MSTRSHLEAVTSSLTELFSNQLIALRLEPLREHYPWLSGGFHYFSGRLDALYFASVNPGWPSPGALLPREPSL